MDLTAARAAVLTEAQNLEKYQPEKWRPGLSDSVVVLQDDDRVFVVGDCVPRVLAALQTYVGGLAPNHVDELGRIHERAVILARRLLAAPPAQIELPTQDWNGVNYLLGKVGINCILTQVPNG